MNASTKSDTTKQTNEDVVQKATTPNTNSNTNLKNPPPPQGLAAAAVNIPKNNPQPPSSTENKKPETTTKHASHAHVSAPPQQKQQPPLKRMDQHPFARSSNVEVMWQGVPKFAQVVDRTSQPPFRYYVHYRDFNRRMDEWITVDRIVSVPSVANAKLKAIEKQKQAKKLALERQSSTHSYVDQSDGTEALIDGADGNSKESEAQRTTRRQKQKRALAEISVDGSSDDPTVSTGAVVQRQKVSDGNQSGMVITVAAEEMDEHEGLDEESLREHEEVTKVKNVSRVELGKYQMNSWYFSPLPKEFLARAGGVIDVLYVCEFSLNFFIRKEELLRFHKKQGKSLMRHPPGNEIYRNGKLSMFEVDGAEEKIYCQNLCYIAKLFLDHKTLYFDVDPFLFYVLCEVDERGFHPVGYFSKEKYSDVGYNLACILTFPSHQRKGYGRFLIDFSYELSKAEEKVGSPEKPMSDLGQQAYKPYWTSTIVDFLRNHSSKVKSLSIMEISVQTSIMAEDIIFTLNQLGILKLINNVYFIAASSELLEKLAKQHPVKNPRVDASKLHWSPYLTEVKKDKFSIFSKKRSVG